MMVYWYQAKLLSKYTSIVSLISYLIVSAYKVYILATAKDVYWFAFSNTFDFLLISIGIYILYKKYGGQKLSFSWELGKNMFSRSKHYILSSMMVTVFAQTDKIMIKLMIDETATGYYGAAVACAGIANFVFTAIIDSFRPYIFEGKKEKEEFFENRLTMLYSIVLYLSLLQSTGMTIFAGLIIHILYGQAYNSAIGALQIVVWYTTFSYLGAVRNIWILANNKQKYLWLINLSGAGANVLINAILIPILGIYGAAIASLITQIFTNVIIGYIIKPIRPNNRIMINGLNPQYCISAVKKVMKRREA